MTVEQVGPRAPHRSIGGILSAAGVAALVMNTEDVKVYFLFWSFVWPIWVLILVAALVGAVVSIGLGIARRHQRRKQRRDERG